MEGAARIGRDRRGGRHGGRDRRGGRRVPGETGAEGGSGAASGRARAALGARGGAGGGRAPRRSTYAEALLLRRSQDSQPRVRARAPCQSTTDQATAVAMHYLVTNTYPSRE